MRTRTSMRVHEQEEKEVDVRRADARRRMDSLKPMLYYKRASLKITRYGGCIKAGCERRDVKTLRRGFSSRFRVAMSASCKRKRERGREITYF